MHTLSSWIDTAKQFHESIFAVVDPLDNTDPLHHYHKLKDKESEGISLLKEGGFSGETDKGAWILPVSDTYLDWWQSDNNSEAGILISTPNDVSLLTAHLVSLFEAHMEGELVYFTFYLPNFISKMAPQFKEYEWSQFLGSATSMIVKSDDGWETHRMASTKNFTPTPAPWWKIKARHVAKFDNIPAMLSNLELWLWEHYPNQLTHHIREGKEIEVTLQTLLTQANPYRSTTYQLLYVAIEFLYGYKVWQQAWLQAKLDTVENDEWLLALPSIMTHIQERVS